MHRLVAFGDLLELVSLGEAGIDLAVEDELVEGVCLFVVGEVRALEALLAHPQVAQIGHRVVTGGARANHDHPAGVAYEHRGGNRIFAGMLEDYPRIFPLTDDIPDGLAERAALRGPLVVERSVLPMRHHAPV